jgi:hypothetical protein
MDELDMSRSGAELFPDAALEQYNSYTDENVGQVVDDPLNTGAIQQDVAGQHQSPQDKNWGALREEISKMKQEREYWKGQAEAYSKQPTQPEASQEDALSALDFDSGSDVRKAFETLRNENATLRNEMKDAFTAISTKSKRNDWDTMVSTHVPELTSKNPIFAEMIQNTSNPYEAAYLLAELNARGQPVAQQNTGYTNQNAQRAIANAQKPQTLASIGSGSGISNADYYANMSDADFHKIAARNLANV